MWHEQIGCQECGSHHRAGWCVVLGACAARSINQVLADPGRYRDREVKLSGSVVDSYSFVGNGAYQIEDNSGKLWVVSNQGVPRKGARVSVKGPYVKASASDPLVTS